MKSVVKSTLSLTTAFALSLGLLASCSKTNRGDAQSAEGTVKIQIIAPGSVNADPLAPMPYSFAMVDLLNVYDLVSVSGKYAQFYTNASRKEQKVIGTQPHAQFLKSKDGVFHPRNYLSLQLATLYYHTQNLVRLEQSLKLDSPRTEPLKIILNTPVLNAKNSENNAFYESTLDAIIYLKYSEADLPLSLNGGVFAHEYFHSIFEKIVLKKLKTNDLFNVPVSINKISEPISADKIKKIDLTSATDSFRKKLANGPMVLSSELNKWYYALLLKGFNEGLADFWGWSYTKDISFISHSLPQTLATRKLDLNAQKITSLQLLSDADMLSIVFQTTDSKFDKAEEKLDLINAFSYMLGTRVALFFMAYSDLIKKERKLTSEATKIVMNQLVVDFVQSMSTTLSEVALAANNTELVTSYSLIYKFVATQILPNGPECEFLKTFLENDSKLGNTLECTAAATNFKLNQKGER